MEITKVEYRVRPVTRYIVTRYHEGDHCGGSETKGEFDNAETASCNGYVSAMAGRFRCTSMRRV